MYPETFFNLFPAFPRENVGFVAMSFDPMFDFRWENVLQPAISNVLVNGTPLEPHRVDLTKAGDSILTEILDQIGRCRVLVADISALGEINGRPVRNQNVFYEIGLAHAVRQPEEVLLFRSDKSELAFDISNVRVHAYDPDGDPDTARDLVTNVIVESRKELALRRQLAVRRAGERLDDESLMVLAAAQAENGLRHPRRRTMREAIGSASRLSAITKLLDLGAIRAEFTRVTVGMLEKEEEEPADGLVSYRITPFGLALFFHLVDELGLTSPEMAPHLERRLKEGLIGEEGSEEDA